MNLPSFSRSLYLNKDLQVPIHPINSISRKQRNGPVFLIMNRNQSLRKPNINLPRRSGSGLTRFLRSGVTLTEESGNLTWKATEDSLLDGVDVGVLASWEVESGENAFSVLEDVDAERGLLRLGLWGVLGERG
jgi:hypothetical protein